MSGLSEMEAGFKKVVEDDDERFFTCTLTDEDKWAELLSGEKEDEEEDLQLCVDEGMGACDAANFAVFKKDTGSIVVLRWIGSEADPEVAEKQWATLGTVWTGYDDVIVITEDDEDAGFSKLQAAGEKKAKTSE